MTGDAMSDELKQGPPPPPPPPDAKPPAPSPSQAPTPSPSVSVEMEPSGQAMQGWRYEYEGQLVGPFSEDALKKEARSRRLTPSMMLTHDDGRRVSASNVVKFDASAFAAARQSAGLAAGSSYAGATDLTWPSMIALSQWQRYCNYAMLGLLPAYFVLGSLLTSESSLVLAGITFWAMGTAFQGLFVNRTLATLKYRGTLAWTMVAVTPNILALLAGLTIAPPAGRVLARLLPYIGLLALFRVSRIATKTIQTQGQPVRLFGTHLPNDPPAG